MNQLTFHRSLTVEQFKAENNASKLEVIKSPLTGKLFLTWGGDTRGAVASAGIPANPMMSYVSGDEGDFWLMHEAPESNNVVATF